MNLKKFCRNDRLSDFSLLAKTQSNAENYFAILCTFARNFQFKYFRSNDRLCDFSLLAKTQSKAENYFATLCAFARE